VKTTTTPADLARLCRIEAAAGEVLASGQARYDAEGLHVGDLVPADVMAALREAVDGTGTASGARAVVALRGRHGPRTARDDSCPVGDPDCEAPDDGEWHSHEWCEDDDLEAVDDDLEVLHGQ